MSPTANTTTAEVEPHPERKEIARFLLSRGDSRFEQAMADDEPLLALPAGATCESGISCRAWGVPGIQVVHDASPSPCRYPAKRSEITIA